MYRVVRSRLLHIFLLLVLVNQVSPMNIKIGALYSKNSERLFKLLEYLLAHEPRELTLKKTFILQLVPLNVDGEDLLSQDVARKLSSVYAIIDLDCKNENVLALSSLLQRPLVKVDNIDEETPHKYALSVRPSYRDVCDALFDMIKFYSFTKVAVVYDARKARQASLFFAKVRKWPRYNAEMMPELPLNNQYKVREALTALLKAHIKQVVLFADQKDLATIMNEALFVGINDKDLKWIASDLEVAGPNKTYPSIRGLVGLSLHLSNTTAAKRLENISKNKVTVPRGANNYSSEMYSAVHDAASVVVKGLNIFLSNKTRVDMAIEFSPNQKCPLRSKKDSMAQAILDDFKKVSFKGFTGTVAFKRTGERKIKTGMDILNILREEVKKIGSWKPELGNKEHNVLPGSSEEPKWIGCFYESVKCHNHNPDPETIGLTPKLPKLNITTVLEPPFVEKVNKSSKLVDLAGKVSKGDLQGFLIDVIDELSKEAQFDYDIYLRPDRKYAKMIEELKNQEKDMALAPITITAQREQDIDFSKPFMDFSLSLIMQKANEPAINNFAFLQPFTGQVWLSTIGVVLFITGMMCVMDYLSPFGYRARALESDEEPGNEFNLLNSLWFATASVLQQGPDSTPLAPSGRLLASTFWFFILILISTYTANLAAFFTIKRTADTINSLEALANQNKIKYGVMNGGSVMTFFENSEDSLYRKMFSHMREYKTFVDGTKAGVEKARTEQYAYITEYPYLEYYNQQKPCNTRLLKNLIQTKSYGIGLQRNSPYTNRITVGILNLRERNFIERKRRRWWDDRSQCPPPSKSKTGNTQSLDVNNLAGVFIILLGGVVISIVLVIIEIRCRKLVDLLTNGKCRKAEEEADGGEVIPTENIRFVEPRVTAPYMINLRPHYDKYAFAPESKL